MPEVARKTDSVDTGHACDGTTTLDTPTGNDNVYAEGQLICRLGDLTVSHDILVGSACVAHVEKIKGSSETVYVRGKLMARKTDAADAGSITSGAETVFNTL